jgi:hypothetical protein
MSNLRKAAEMALKALENMSPDTDTLVEVEPHVWEYRGSLVIQALRQALNDKPAVKSYAGGKPNYCTPVDAVPGFTVTEPRQSLSRMKPGDRFVLVRTGEICRIENDGSHWNETAQRPSRFHKNSQVRLIVDAVNMTPERVDETVKSEHEPEGWVKIDEVRKYFDSVGCGTIYKTAGEDRVKTPLPRITNERMGWADG